MAFTCGVKGDDLAMNNVMFVSMLRAMFIFEQLV